MAKGLIGKKIGCTQLWKDDEYVMVTAILTVPNVVILQKTKEKDGYTAVKVGYQEAKPTKMSRPHSGEFAKRDLTPHRYMIEFRDMQAEVGTKLDVSLFSEGEHVDIVGTSRGMGFQGVMKRHNFAGGDDSHGAMEFHRRPGSIGCRLTPGHVIKGMRMPGHMGNVRVKARNLKVVKVDQERGVMLVKGTVPGPKGANVFIYGK